MNKKGESKWVYPEQVKSLLNKENIVAKEISQLTAVGVYVEFNNESDMKKFMKGLNDKDIEFGIKSNSPNTLIVKTEVLMNKEQELREAIRAQIKELHGFNDLDNPEESTASNAEEVKEIIKTAIRNSSLYKDSNKEWPEETIYNAITEEYDIVSKSGLKEGENLQDLIKQRNEINNQLDKIVKDGGKIVLSDPLFIKSKALTKKINKLKGLKEDHSEFLDKVEDNMSGDVIDGVNEVILNLRDIQKKLLKFRPKLVDEVAQATLILEGVQNKLSDGEPIGEGKDNEPKINNGLPKEKFIIFFTPEGENLYNEFSKKMEADDDYYDKASKDEILISDMGLYIDGAYAANNTDRYGDLKKWAEETSKGEGPTLGQVLKKLKKGIDKGWIEINSKYKTK